MKQREVGSKTKHSTETVQKRHTNRKHACSKGEVASAWREKMLYSDKRNGENVGHIIRNVVILN